MNAQTLTYGIGRDRFTCDPGELRRILETAHETKAFGRLAGTALDIDTGAANPYWNIVRLMATESDPWMDPWPVESYPFNDEHPVIDRKKLCKTFAWSIPSPADILWMRDVLAGRSVVEIGAGSGYWAWQLTQLGIDVIAYDNKTWEFEHEWFDVVEGDATSAALHNERALLLVWPPYGDPMASETLNTYDGDLLVYVGEGPDGCTGDETFHDQLAANWVEIGESPHHPTFSGIHCRVTAYRRGH